MKTIVLTTVSHGHELGDEVEVDDERAEDLVGSGVARYVEVQKVRPSRPPVIKDVLAEVGDDKDKAAAALEQEKAGENRTTLVAALTKLVEG